MWALCGDHMRGYRWCGFTAWEQELECVFNTAVCKIQDSECHVESLPIVLKDKRHCFPQGEIHCTAASWSCACPLEVGRLIDIWKPSVGSQCAVTIYYMFSCIPSGVAFCSTVMSFFCLWSCDADLEHLKNYWLYNETTVTLSHQYLPTHYRCKMTIVDQEVGYFTGSKPLETLRTWVQSHVKCMRELKLLAILAPT